MSKSKSDSRLYFILLHNLKEEPILGPGTLWIQEQKLSKDLVLVAKYDGDNIGMLKQIEVKYLKKMFYEETHLLLGVEPLSDRIKVINDSIWMKEGLEIKVDTVVRIFDVPGLENGALGTVRFKGRLPGRNGTSFGIELHKEHAGKGTTDGMFRYKRLFTCKEDCGVFLSILRIRKAFTTDITTEKRSSAEGSSFNQSTDQIPHNNDSYLPDDPNLQIDERVVWMSDFGPEFGTVKWIGKLPHSVDNKTVIGVEFDNPVGSGTGKYKGYQLFKAKRNYASLIPVLGLLKASVYMSMMSSGNDIEEEKHSTEYQDIKIGGADRDDLIPTIRSNEEWVDPFDKKSSLQIENKFPDLKLIDSSDQMPIEQADGVSSKRGQDELIGRSPKEFEPQHLDLTAHNLIDKNNFSGARPKVFSNIRSPKCVDESNQDHSSNKTLNVKDDISISQPNHVTMGEYEQQFFKVKVGSRVSITLGSERYGIVRWIGTFTNSKTPDRLIAGIEMDEEDLKCYTDGRFQGERVFDCPPKRGLFFPLNKCEPDIR